MKDLNRNWIIVISLILAGWASAYYMHHHRVFHYVFINETTDHRFDESIRMSILASYKRTGVQNAVFISDRDLNGESIESVATRLFNELELGRNNSGRAILYYYSPQNKSLKIEVGYALEGILPDSTIKGLEQAAKSFIFVERYQDFWAELINTLNIEIAEKEQGLELSSTGFDFANFKFLSGGAGVSSQFYNSTWEQFQLEFKRADEATTNQYKAQNSPEGSLQVYFESLKNGLGEAHFDILTPESQFFRQQVPMTSFQLYRNWRMYLKARVENIFTLDNLAFVFFEKNNPVLPIVLKKSDNLWRIDEPLSWSLFQRFEDTNQVFLKYPIEPVPDDLKKYLISHFGRPLFELKNPLTLELLTHSKPDLKNLRSLLVQLYALDHAERLIAQLDVNELTDDQLKFAADVYSNLGLVSSFLKIYRIIAQKEPENKALQTNLKFYEKTYNFKDSEWRLQLK